MEAANCYSGGTVGHTVTCPVVRNHRQGTHPSVRGSVGTSSNGSLPSSILSTVSWNRGSVYIGLQSTDGRREKKV